MARSNVPQIAIDYDKISSELAALIKRYFTTNEAGVGEHELLARVTEGWEYTFDAKEVVQLVDTRLQIFESNHVCGRCLDLKVVPGWAVDSEFSASLYLGSHTDFATHCRCSSGDDIPLDSPTGDTCDLCRGQGIIPDWIHYLFHPQQENEDWLSGYECRGIDWTNAVQAIDLYDQDPSSTLGPNPGSDEFLRDLVPAWLPKPCPSCAGWGVHGSSEAPLAQVAVPSTETTHSPDFSTVNWYGTQYRFSKGNQTGVVKALWKAWSSGKHGLNSETIGSTVKPTSDSFSVRDTFRVRRSNQMHPAWDTMIKSIGKGAFALVPPDKNK